MWWMMVGLAWGAPEQVLTLATPDRVGSFLAPISQTSLDSAVLDAVSLSLARADFSCEPTWRPSLARDWSWSEGGRVLTMELRRDARFADGTPITARDVAFTYSLLADRELGSHRAYFVQRMDPDGAPQVLDDHRIAWHFEAPYERAAQLAHVGVVHILPAHRLAEVPIRALSAHPLARAPLATGPFQIAAHDPGVQVVLERNPHHADGLPHLERVIFRLLPDYETRLHELLTGGIDGMSDVQIQDLPRLAAHPEIRLYRRGWRHMDFVAWNLKRPLFEDPRVRRALAHAVDVQALIDELFTVDGEAYARPSVGTITPELCEVHNHRITPLAYDPALARKLLVRAGWRDSDGDGVLDRGGEPFRFTLDLVKGNARRAAAAERIQQMLGAVGVEVVLRRLDPHVLIDNLDQGRYEAALAGWAAALFVDPSNMWGTGGSRNFPGYSSKKADRLIDRGLSTLEPRKANRQWRKLQAEIHEDQPYLFLYWMNDVVAVNRRVQGVQTDLISAWRDLYRWRIEADGGDPGPGR